MPYVVDISIYADIDIYVVNIYIYINNICYIYIYRIYIYIFMLYTTSSPHHKGAGGEEGQKRPRKDPLQRLPSALALVFPQAGQ